MVEKRASNSYETNIDGHSKINKPEIVKPMLFSNNTLTCINNNVSLGLDFFNIFSSVKYTP